MRVSDFYRVALVDIDGEVVVMVSGEIDLAAQDRLRQVVDQARSGERRLVLDLSEVTFIDSSGLKALVDAWRSQSEAGGRMVLRGSSPAVRTVMEMTGLWELLAVEPGPARRTGSAETPEA